MIPLNNHHSCWILGEDEVDRLQRASCGASRRIEVVRQREPLLRKNATRLGGALRAAPSVRRMKTHHVKHNEVPFGSFAVGSSKPQCLLDCWDWIHISDEPVRVPGLDQYANWSNKGHGSHQVVFDSPRRLPKTIRVSGATGETTPPDAGKHERLESSVLKCAEDRRSQPGDIQVLTGVVGDCTSNTKGRSGPD